VERIMIVTSVTLHPFQGNPSELQVSFPAGERVTYNMAAHSSQAGWVWAMLESAESTGWCPLGYLAPPEIVPQATPPPPSVPPAWAAPIAPAAPSQSSREALTVAATPVVTTGWADKKQVGRKLWLAVSNGAQAAGSAISNVAQVAGARASQVCWEHGFGLINYREGMRGFADCQLVPDSYIEEKNIGVAKEHMALHSKARMHGGLLHGALTARTSAPASSPSSDEAGAGVDPVHPLIPRRPRERPRRALHKVWLGRRPGSDVDHAPEPFRRVKLARDKSQP
ncbi:hypothetical protein THAOC_34971, partial [Thalassiosira oceanica]